MIIDELRKYWQAEDFDRFHEIYSPDALLDIHVPHERLQYQGRAAIVDFWHEDFDGKQFRFLRWLEHPTEWGAVIETAVIGDAVPTPKYYRWVNLLFVERDRITRHVIYCTGEWDQAAAARWEEEATCTTSSS